MPIAAGAEMTAATQGDSESALVILSLFVPAAVFFPTCGV